MRMKTCMGLERFEVDKTLAFSHDFPEIPEITEILEILEILEMGFTKEWFVLKIASKYVPLRVWALVNQKVASTLLKTIATYFLSKSECV